MIDDPTKMSQVQMQCVQLMYKSAKDFLRKAAQEDREDWESIAECIYNHMASEHGASVQIRMLQVATMSQLLECLLAHMSDEGTKIMRDLDGPMAALIVRAYTEVRREAMLPAPEIWPTVLP